MSNTADSLLADALLLPQDERRRVAEELWNSLDDAWSDLANDDEFWAEMERRKQELDADPSQALTHEDVMASVDQAIQCISATTAGPAKS